MAADPSETVVELRGVSLDYGNNRVLDHFDLRVQRGELVALLGPSGSGKTTVIRTIAGFLDPSEGQVLLAGSDVTYKPAHRRGVGVVFQSYALFPHLSVFDNIAYPLRGRRVGRSALKKRCDELIELVRLGDQEHKKPAKLSGGQQQRVALARALAMDPEVLLLDEPLSNLDANLRRDVGEEIRRLQQRTNTTAIMVTHDRQEAFGMADRIAVLRGGKIEQLGTPRELYRSPATRFLAEFVGESNIVVGRIISTESDGEKSRVLIDSEIGELRVDGSGSPGKIVEILIRPEDLSFQADATGLNTITATLKETFYYGSNVVATVQAGNKQLSLIASGSSFVPPDIGHQVRLSIEPGDCILLDGAS
ncbi:ABC transporter ATP-binding protein [Saxibacter everestensis]|uniref:ABC transporter ATP-binding protein n=1 Tax=Saxibacter everestensis TaxID=2909229 RepID=A0ABY8QTH7_9MICO|nr:ABC transporter ATP-binding protein [Brevibacteriaceae bacterium ZFBP1038]